MNVFCALQFSILKYFKQVKKINRETQNKTSVRGELVEP